MLNQYRADVRVCTALPVDVSVALYIATLGEGSGGNPGSGPLEDEGKPYGKDSSGIGGRRAGCCEVEGSCMV